MKLTDLVVMAAHNLKVRWLRTVLNLVGVTVGSVLLLLTLAASDGIKRAILRLVNQSEHARQFRIYPDYDRSVQPPSEQLLVSDDVPQRRRGRLRDFLEDDWRRNHQQRKRAISEVHIEQIRSLDHVRDVSPRHSARCTLATKSLVADDDGGDADRRDLAQRRVVVRSCSPLDSGLRDRLVAGRMVGADATDEVLVHEGLAYRLGFESDKELEQLIGQVLGGGFAGPAQAAEPAIPGLLDQVAENPAAWLKVMDQLVSGSNLDSLDPQSRKLIAAYRESRKTKLDEGPAGSFEVEWRIVGVFRQRDEQDVENVLDRFSGGAGDLLVHHRAFESELRQTVSGGVSQADVFVDQFANLKPTLAACQAMGLRAVSATGVIDRLVESINRYRWAASAVVLIVMVVSSIGVANTMLISLMERTEEIGILKALGAGNRDVGRLILAEGLVTGLLGGILALGVGVGVGYLGNEMLKDYVESRSRLPLEGMLLRVEPWMAVATVGLAVVTTAVAGWWPAWRAARIDPVSAMSER